MKLSFTIFALATLGESYTLINYSLNRHCSGGNLQCSNIDARICCQGGNRDFRSTKFKGINSGDICPVFHKPDCGKVDNSGNNQRCVAQTYTKNYSRLGGSAVYRVTGKRDGTDSGDQNSICTSTQMPDIVNMDGFSYNINYDVPQNITDGLIEAMYAETPRHMLAPALQELGWAEDDS